MLTSVPRSDADFCRGTLKRRRPMTNRHRNCRKAAGLSNHGHQRLRAVESSQRLMLACERRPLLNDPGMSRLASKQRPNAGEVPRTTKIMQFAKPHGKRIEASYLQKPTPQELVTFVVKRRGRRLSISFTVCRFVSKHVRLCVPSWF